VVVTATAEYENADGTYSQAQIYVQFDENDFVVGKYAKVDIIDPENGESDYFEIPDIAFTWDLVAVTSWDDERNGGETEGSVPTDGTHAWTMDILEGDETSEYRPVLVDQPNSYYNATITMCSEWFGAVLITATSPYTNPDSKKPFDQILITIADDGMWGEVIIGNYAKTEITKPANGAEFKKADIEAKGLKLEAAVTWDDVKNYKVVDGEPGDTDVVWEVTDEDGETVVGLTVATDPDGATRLKGFDDFEGTIIIRATANHKNPDGEHPFDEVRITFTGEDIIVGKYFKVRITAPADGTKLTGDETLEVNLYTVITWDDEKNGGPTIGGQLPADNDVQFAREIKEHVSGDIPSITGNTIFNNGDFRGTVKVSVATYEPNPDGTYPTDSIYLTFTDTGVIVGHYLKVDIVYDGQSEYSRGDGGDEPDELDFDAIVSWDEEKSSNDGPAPQEVTWTFVADGTGGEGMSISNTGVLTGFDDFVGSVTVTATAATENPDETQASDAIVITFTPEKIEVGTQLIQIVGTVKLAKKARNDIPFLGYTVRQDLDAGIDVVLCDDGIRKAGTVTANDGGFILFVPEATVLTDGSDFTVRIARRDGEDVGLRDEAYMEAEFTLQVVGATVTTDKIDLGTVWLYPGDFDNSRNDYTISQEDYADIKQRVGLTSAETDALITNSDDRALYGGIYYAEKYDINEYTGIDGGDLASVKSGVGKTMATEYGNIPVN
jgi:hypothetical protein